MRYISIAVLVLMLFSVSNADAADYLGFINSYGDGTAQVIAMADRGTIAGAGYAGENRIGPQSNTKCCIFSVSRLYEETFKLVDITPDAETIESEYGGWFMGFQYKLKPFPRLASDRALWWTGSAGAVKTVNPERNVNTYARFATEILHENGMPALSVAPEDVHQIIRCDFLSDGTDEVVYIFDSLKRESPETGFMKSGFSGVVLRYIDKQGNVQSNPVYLCANDNVSRTSLDVNGEDTDNGVLWSWGDADDSDGDYPPATDVYTDAYELVGILDMNGNGDYEFVLYYQGYEWFGYEVVDFDGGNTTVLASADWGA